MKIPFSFSQGELLLLRPRKRGAVGGANGMPPLALNIDVRR